MGESGAGQDVQMLRNPGMGESGAGNRPPATRPLLAAIPGGDECALS
jgi:hypothetical protein